MLNQRQQRKTATPVIKRTWDAQPDLPLDKPALNLFKKHVSLKGTLFDPSGVSEKQLEFYQTLNNDSDTRPLTMHPQHIAILDYLLANDGSITLDAADFNKNQRVLGFMEGRGWIDLLPNNTVQLAERMARLMVGFKQPRKEDEGKVWRFRRLIIIADDTVPAVYHAPAGKTVSVI